MAHQMTVEKIELSDRYLQAEHDNVINAEQLSNINILDIHET
jgi:hypothetical protein